MRAALSLISLWGLALACTPDRVGLMPPPTESDHQSLILTVTDGEDVVVRALNLSSATWPQSFALPEISDLPAARIEAFAYLSALDEMGLEEGRVLAPAGPVPCERGRPDRVWVADPEEPSGWRLLDESQKDFGILLGEAPCTSNLNCIAFDQPTVRFLPVRSSLEGLEVLGPGRFLVASRGGGAWQVGPNLAPEAISGFDDWTTYGSATGPDGLIYLGGSLGRLRILDPSNLTFTSTAVPSDKQVTGISFSPTGVMLVVASLPGEPTPDQMGVTSSLEIWMKATDTWQLLFQFDTGRSTYSQVNIAWLDEDQAFISHGGRETVRIVGTQARIDESLEFSQAFVRSKDHVYVGQRATGVSRISMDGTLVSLVGLVGGRGPDGFLAIDDGIIVGQECGYFYQIRANDEICASVRHNDHDHEILRRDSEGTVAIIGGSIYGQQGSPVIFYEAAL